jgi:hypothetical protein
LKALFSAVKMWRLLLLSTRTFYLISLWVRRTGEPFLLAMQRIDLCCYTSCELLYFVQFG